MGARLAIDLEGWALVSRELSTVAAAFDATDLEVDLLTTAIGATHETHELRAAVEHFAGAWRIRREQASEQIRDLSHMSGTVVERLEQADRELASSVAATPASGGAAAAGASSPGSA